MATKPRRSSEQDALSILTGDHEKVEVGVQVPPRRVGSSLDLKSAFGPTDTLVVGAQRCFSNPTEGVSHFSAPIGFSERPGRPSLSPPE